MGYEDRDYMRESSPGGTGGGGNNPLWWILGLIALVLVVGAARRGSLPQRDSLAGRATPSGPLRICTIQFADAERAEALLLLLKSFFRERGYDSMIHETADGTLSTASFEHRSSDEHSFQRFSYRRVSGDHASLKPKHQLLGLVLHPGVEDPSELIDESLLLAEELRLRLEQELPGIVTRFEDDPEPMSYQDFE